MESKCKWLFIWGSVLLSLMTTQQAGNVAPRGTAKQSSKSASPETGPYMALDENIRPNSFEETCSSVPKQNSPWWLLDLGAIYHVTAVSVISKGDCCPEQLNGTEVRVGLSDDIPHHRCGVISTVQGTRKYTFQCEVMEARFVQIMLPLAGVILTVCEVQVYGTILENVALRGVAFQSSLRWKTTGKASSVLDGNRISTCSVTENNTQQWLKVDLLVPHKVNKIQLAIINDCCSGIAVSVDNTRCVNILSTLNNLVTIDCDGIVGRDVTVWHPNIPLTLCEVEVYSTWEHPQNTFPQRPPPYSHCSSTSCSRDFILIRDEPMTWFESQSYCRERYTDLATINNPQDFNKVTDDMGKDTFWIGLYEDVVTWRWSLPDEDYYGDSETEFRNWDVGEPNSVSGIQHCAGMQHTGEWKDLDCGLLNFFLCFDGRDGAIKTKILVETPMKWADAQNYCRQNHTDLFSVRKMAENKDIASMVPAGKVVWIGLYGDSWKWSDGSNSMFRYWNKGVLDSVGAGPNCAYVDDKLWSVRSCNTKSMFLCYYYKKRYMVKISTDFDMSDEGIQQQLIKQLGTEMKKKGISDVKISWRMSRGPVPREKRAEKSPVCRRDGGEL